MAQKNDAVPVEHGLGSSAAITASETGKGLVSGILGGGWRGAVLGGLMTAALPLLAFSALGAGLTTLAVVAGISALPGMVAGAGLGAPAGAVVGTMRGMGRGMDRVGRDNAAAQIVRTQERTAEAQVKTAEAIQARVIERMSEPAPAVPAAAPQPERAVSGAEYQGKGVATAVAQGMGTHTQRYHHAQAQMGAEQQIG